MIDGLNKIWNKFLNFLEDKEMYKSYEGVIIPRVCGNSSEKNFVKGDIRHNENT